MDAIETRTVPFPPNGDWAAVCGSAALRMPHTPCGQNCTPLLPFSFFLREHFVGSRRRGTMDAIETRTVPFPPNRDWAAVCGSAALRMPRAPCGQNCPLLLPFSFSSANPSLVRVGERRRVRQKPAPPYSEPLPCLPLSRRVTSITLPDLLPEGYYGPF